MLSMCGLHGYNHHQQPGSCWNIKGFCTRILVVDDFEPWHRFVSTLLQSEPSLKIVGQAFDGSEVIQKARELIPDLILLDIGLPRLNGLDVARQIREHSPNATILFCSEHLSPEIVETALGTGALGYVVKRDAASELLPAVETVVRGKAFVSSSLIGCGLINADGEYQARHGKSVSRFSMQKSIANGSHKHCSDDAALLDDLADAVEAALDKGSAVLVVTTESHRASLLQQLRADGVDIDAAADRNLYISIDVPDSAVVDTLTDEDGFPKGVRNAIVETLRAAKEKHLPFSVG